MDVWNSLFNKKTGCVHHLMRPWETLPFDKICLCSPRNPEDHGVDRGGRTMPDRSLREKPPSSFFFWVTEPPSSRATMCRLQRAISHQPLILAPPPPPLYTLFLTCVRLVWFLAVFSLVRRPHATAIGHGKSACYIFISETLIKNISIHF